MTALYASESEDVERFTDLLRKLNRQHSSVTHSRTATGGSSSRDSPAKPALTRKPHMSSSGRSSSSSLHLGSVMAVVPEDELDDPGSARGTSGESKVNLSASPQPLLGPTPYRYESKLKDGFDYSGFFFKFNFLQIIYSNISIYFFEIRKK